MEVIHLNIGAGTRPAPGHINIDIHPGPGIDMVAPAWELPFGAEMVTSIICHHMIEHLFPYQWPLVLDEWNRVLKPGGKVGVSCPDFEAVARAYAQGKTDMEWARTTLMGTCPPFNSVDYDDPASYHRTLHSAASIARDFERHGLAVYSIFHDQWWECFVFAEKEMF